MFRKILSITPALAFTLPFVAAQPTMAKPLTAPVQVSEWGDDDDDDDNQQIELQFCTALEFEYNTDDGRSYECAIDKGPSCLARCTPEAVAPLCGGELGLAARSGACVPDTIAACERQCEERGAAFCSPLKARWGDNDDDDQEVFIEIQTCLDLEVNH